MIDTELIIEGYHPPVNNLDQDGRGICIYVSQLYGVEDFSLDIVNVNDFKESVWVNVKIGKKKSVVIGCVYRSPSSDSANNRKLESLLRAISDKNFKHLVIVGDFNYPNVNWDTCTSTDREGSECDQFLESLKDCFLVQHVEEPTRYRGTQRPSLLDLVLTAEENVIRDMRILAPLGNSDHCTIVFDYICQQELSSSKTRKFKYDKGNYADMRASMANIDWKQELSTKDTQESWDRVNVIITEAMNEHIPTHTGGHAKKKRQIYMDRSAMKQVKAKQRAWQKYTETQDLHDYELYCKTRNKLRSYTRNLRKTFEESLAYEAKLNPKAFWRYTKTRSTVKSGVSDLQDSEGVMRGDDEDKAEILNDFFCSVFTKENTERVPTVESRCNVELSSITITEDIVGKHLKKLKVSKSAGPDGLHPRVLKEIAQYITEPLKMIYMKSIASGMLPSQWKQGHITPIFKKGNRSQPGNYRPVSLTSVLCKVLEAIIREQVMKHMVDNNLFCDEQHGFVPGRSCMTQLITCLDEWTEMLDNGDPLDVVYLDFKKAFDTVPHQRLVNKLESYGIKGEVKTWITNFLNNRTQRVSVNGNLSNWADVTSGIPQGSVLGPVLFVIFINDLPNAVRSVVRIFADDTKMYGKATTTEDRVELQKDIDNLSKWSDNWQLKFNTNKCSVMHLGHNNVRTVYHMNDNDGVHRDLKESVIEKDLGVHVDNKLSFHQHIDESVKKANRTLGLIKRTFISRDKMIIKKLYTTMVRPILEYGNSARIHQYAGDTDRIEKVQRRATKMCSQLRELPYERRLKEMKLPSMHYRRERGDMIEVYKILTGKNKVDQERLLPLNTSDRTRGHNLRLTKKRSRLNIRKCSFGLRVVNNWNALPDWVVNATDVNDFKSKLDKHWSGREYSTRSTHVPVINILRRPCRDWELQAA